jgi:SAM-dependent MidA family methyltransferase
MRPVELPSPAPSALAVSRALLERIGAELEMNGNWITFARFMEMALHEPALGYYAGGSAKLGASGDFLTAPGSSPLFAQTLARQLADLLGPGDAVLEFGAGDGALAEVLCAELACPYYILETSAELRDRQSRRLPGRVRWFERLPERFCGVMLANEVLDAMPVHAITWTRDGVLERGVCANEGTLSWCERPARGAVLEAARALQVEIPPSGRYESELALAARAWLHALGQILERGAILIVDYGFPEPEFFHPQRSMGTLACHYRHYVHADPFFYPGLQDVTAHVDFSALTHAACDSGLAVLGYTSQANFLVNCGIIDLLGVLDPGDAKRYAPAAAAVNRLLSPAEMGELYKVLALGRGLARPLRGFARGDRSGSL